jgi:hypothetical protein
MLYSKRCGEGEKKIRHRCAKTQKKIYAIMMVIEDRLLRPCCFFVLQSFLGRTGCKVKGELTTSWADAFAQPSLEPLVCRIKG